MNQPPQVLPEQKNNMENIRNQLKYEGGLKICHDVSLKTSAEVFQ